MSLYITNVEKDARTLQVLVERDGIITTIILKPGEAFVLREHDRFLGFKAQPRHLGMTIDTGLYEAKESTLS